MATPDSLAAPVLGPLPGGWRSAGLVRNLLAGLVFAAAVSGLVWFFAGSGDSGGDSRSVSVTAKASGPAPRIGQPAPDFQAAGLDGTPVSLASLRGHPVWLTFWATWCPPCRRESPDIEAAFRQYAPQGLALVAIDVGENAPTVRDYVQRLGLTFPVAGDPATEIAASYRVTGLPTHIFIDATGTVREIRHGALSRQAMDAEIAPLIGPDSSK